MTYTFSVEVMSTPVAFSSDGTEIITRKIDVSACLEGTLDRKTPDEIEKFYEINRCLSFITDNGYQRVGVCIYTVHAIQVIRLVGC